ncbi:hypothetical protein DAEQUDRAFT_734444 [Daedalea quercina L-15889]|uniref:Uncharacterized protein n=1 Tax=Daedalea quercina L-15889 TaxID=1314783 RepID=A0A165UHR3_9APHY|nr:hypothetical protein DAEQUDRAFT_734444 [Daedalea quercina L-15889]
MDQEVFDSLLAHKHATGRTFHKANLVFHECLLCQAYVNCEVKRDKQWESYSHHISRRPTLEQGIAPWKATADGDDRQREHDGSESGGEAHPPPYHASCSEAHVRNFALRQFIESDFAAFSHNVTDTLADEAFKMPEQTRLPPSIAAVHVYKTGEYHVANR